MPIMALFLLAFFIAIAVATFVENDFGTPVAQKWIYKAKWFEGILLYLFITMLYNIYRYKLVQLKKIGSLTFHVAFLVILIGAWITRIFGFEGNMTIREGDSSNIIISSDTYLQIKVHNQEQQYVYDMPVIMDGYTDNYFEHSFDFPGQSEPISLEFVDLKEQVKDTIVATGKTQGDPYLELVTVGPQGRKYNYLKSGEVLIDETVKIAFNNSDYTEAISIFETDSGIHVNTPYDLTYFEMSTQTNGLVLRDSIQLFQRKRLYSLGTFQFVFNAYYPAAKVETIESEAVDKVYKALTISATQGNLSQNVELRGGKGVYPTVNKFQQGDLYYELAYGSKLIELPFYLYLDDFEMARYPGTPNPSSFSSKVTLIDPAKNLEEPHHIYMNNVLDYGGYRFFQSNYDPDEKGTILSVNHDALGTNVTYIGYLLLALGFVIALFNSGGRFRHLLRKSAEIRKKRMDLSAVLLLIGLSISGSINAQDVGNARDNAIFDGVIENPVIDADHAEKYGRLVIQSQRGRFQPVHTLATDILKKTSRSATYEEQTAMQVWLGIHTNSLAWNLEPFIYVSGQALQDELGIEGKYAAFVDFFGQNFEYKLQKKAETARRKKPAEQSQFDKDVLKTDERVNILFGVFQGVYLKIMPLPNDPAENWYSPFDVDHPFEGEDAEFFNTIVPLYNTTVNRAHETGNWDQANQVVDLIDVFQRRVADPETIPSKEKIEIEITYNKLDLFKKLNYSYLLVGFLILILTFVQLFKPKLTFKWPYRAGVALFLIMFITHGIGLGLRWYLSGHAPWSNGYEAVVFIAFITVLAGLLFAKQSMIILGATGILAWLMLFVAHMNALDPEITDLVPVLKSYWLMIHVAIITGSYGFLGLGAILGLIILIINLFLSRHNKKHVLMTTKELTYVSEMTIMIGLFMLTIGTFLGGVWANESWGRYWGWDAKETWALASVLVYAIILHFRFIPFLKSQFVFNVASLLAYGSIIMTFFGVNFYLSGLHSYAQGDPVPIPVWVPITVGLIIALCILSGWRLRDARKDPVQ